MYDEFTRLEEAMCTLGFTDAALISSLMRCRSAACEEVISLLS
jgi:hypothetical protein